MSIRLRIKELIREKSAREGRTVTQKEVAAVAAGSRQQPGEALAAIVVDYECLPFVIDLETAKSPGAPLVHDAAPGNLVGEPDCYTRGDVDAGFAEADFVGDQESPWPGFVEEHLAGALLSRFLEAAQAVAV